MQSYTVAKTIYTNLYDTKRITAVHPKPRYEGGVTWACCTKLIQMLIFVLRRFDHASFGTLAKILGLFL
jgi:hypothetical protein